MYNAATAIASFIKLTIPLDKVKNQNEYYN
jgi:hypothetical protein